MLISELFFCRFGFERPHQVEFHGLHMRRALGYRLCVEAFTPHSALSLASEDPAGMPVNPQIPVFPLIFSSIYANGE